MLSVLFDGRHCRPTLTVAKMTTVIDGRQCRLVCRGLNGSFQNFFIFDLKWCDFAASFDV